MYKRIFILFLILSFAMSGTLASAQNNNQPAGTVPAETPQTTQELSISETGLVSIDFRDADIQNIFKVLALKSGVNIVVSPAVTGVVSIQLKNVPWEEALDVIVKTYGFAMERRGNIIMITTVEDLRKRREDAALLTEQEPLETQTYRLSFGRAEEVITSVDKMKSERGSVNYDERTNTIIATDTTTRLKLIGDVVKKLDRTTPQVLIESKMVKKNFVDTENLGTTWTVSLGAQGAKRTTTWPFSKSSENRYLLDGFRGGDDEIEASDFIYGTLNASQLSAVFEALKTRSDTEVLSSPRVVTLDNKQAKIFVGTDYPIPNYQFNEETGLLQVNGFEWKEIGVVFEVTPHVNNDEFVTLDVKPTVSSSGTPVVFENTSLPLISKEEASTSVMIRTGDTLVIAGLVQDTVIKSDKRVPWIAEIPIIGWPFRKKEFNDTKTDLLVFITPYILNSEASNGTGTQPVSNEAVTPEAAVTSGDSVKAVEGAVPADAVAGEEAVKGSEV
jgi:type IV pilus assembly protein PilQ